ncbi:MAG: hypothetical protein IV090_16645 [Candidatus Sericytochromatia bacterium]|nr:hypothetical protein [Candidatus Sericytochromatia bacterium]
MSNAQYIPTSQSQTTAKGKPYVIRFVEGVLITDTFIHKQKGNFADLLDVINCTEDSSQRRAENKLTNPQFINNDKNKHGIGWPDTKALEFATSQQKPQGRFGGPNEVTGGLLDINQTIRLATQVCPGARQWFKFPTPNHSHVFLPPTGTGGIFDPSRIVDNPTHVYVQVKTGTQLGEVHAYPAFLPEIIDR